jgi:excinuclease ABC subunit C
MLRESWLLKSRDIEKKIEHLETYRSRSVIVNENIERADVFRCFVNSVVYINYLMVENGTIVQTHTTEAKTQLEETDEEIMALQLPSYATVSTAVPLKLFCPLLSISAGRYLNYDTEGRR